MKYIWEKFRDDYPDIEKYPIIVILEAFWNYSYDHVKAIPQRRCQDVFDRFGDGG